MMLWPKEAGKFIASKAQEVYIMKDGIERLALVIANNVKQGMLNMDYFKQNEVLPLNKDLTIDQLVNWIFLVDALNFNFWTPKGAPKYTVNHNGKRSTGYMAMVSAINRAIDEGKPIYDPKYYSLLSSNDLMTIFCSDTDSEMPLFEKRMEVLKEIGNILIKNYNGSFANILKLSNGSAMNLVDIVTTNFPCFKDVHIYMGVKVAIFKRAQILAADIALLYHGSKLNIFDDLDKLTMFADYRVPQALVHFGVITYSDNLMKKLHDDFLFENGDKEEVEIRGVSIHATELIVEETKKILQKWNLVSAHINSIKVDFFLWDYRYNNADELESVPYHKTRCIFY